MPARPGRRVLRHHAARAAAGRPGAVAVARARPARGTAIVRADGSLAKGDRQKELLIAEGVRFIGDRVDMARFRVRCGSSAT